MLSLVCGRLSVQMLVLTDLSCFKMQSQFQCQMLGNRCEYQGSSKMTSKRDLFCLSSMQKNPHAQCQRVLPCGGVYSEFYM